MTGGKPVITLSPKHRLGLFDSTCLIVGIIVGSGIYETPVMVAAAVNNHWQLYLLWACGGLISLCGAMCYAELATMYPETGGDVVYLQKAYGPSAGFLFGWLQTFVARPGDISIMALVFAHYVHVLVDPSGSGERPIWPAIAIVALLTFVNIAGLQFGKATQNLLTVTKIIGLFAIMGIAFCFPPESSPRTTTEVESVSLGVALIMVLFTFGGWNEMVYVASEVRDPHKNIWRALVLGSVAVTCLYLMMNIAYLRSLGLVGMATSDAIATEAVSGLLPRGGQMLVAAIITVSVAGAINGLILTGARITGAMRSFPAFQWIGVWHPRLHTPARALVLEGSIAVGVIAIAQTFENALIYTSAAVYTFYLATSLSTAVMRYKTPDAERLYRVPFFPLPLIIFATACLMTIWSAINYRKNAAFVCLGILAVGAIVYAVQARRSCHPR